MISLFARAMTSLVLSLAAFTGLPSVSAAADDNCGLDCEISSDDREDLIQGSILIPAKGYEGDSGLRQRAAACPGCSWQVSPWCLAAEPGGTITCMGAATSCERGSLRYALFLKRPGDADFRRVGSFCRRPGQPLTPTELVPQVRDRFIEFLPEQRPSYQPSEGALVNLAAVFASGQPTSIGRKTFDLAGFGIELTADAVWQWDFGDGTARPFDVPGGPYPDLGVSHVYRTPGPRAVQVTTVWQGSFTVDGLGPFTVEGPPVTQTATLTVPVREARAELVAG